MYQLARKLVFRSSAREMKEILEDYEQFSADGAMTESPADIVKSLDESGRKAILSYALLGMFLVGNVAAFKFIYRLNYRPDDFLLSVSILIFLSLLFPPLVSFTIGRKLRLLSNFYSCGVKQRCGIWLAHILCLLMVCSYGALAYTTGWDFGLDPATISTLTITMGQSYIAVAVILVVLLGYFALTRGAAYYFSVCNAYTAFCTLFLIRQNYARLSSVEQYFSAANMATICYFVGIAWNAAWLFLLKRKKDSLHERSNKKRHS